MKVLFFAPLSTALFLLWSCDLCAQTSWTKYPGNPVLPVNPSMKGASSGMVVHDGTRFRLYTTHPDVRVYFPRAR